MINSTRRRLLRMKRLPIYKIYAYMLPRTDRLSRCLSELRVISQGVERDNDMDGSGDCGSLILRNAQRAASSVAHSYGFTNVEAVLAIAESRTRNYSQQLSTLGFLA